MSDHHSEKFTFEDFFEMTKGKLHQAAGVVNEFVHAYVTADNIPPARYCEPSIEEDELYIDRYMRNKLHIRKQKPGTSLAGHKHEHHHRQGQKSIKHH